MKERGFVNIILIFVGFFLVAIVAGFFVSKKTLKPVAFPNVTGTAYHSPFSIFSPTNCGLTVVTPQPESTVSSPIKITGYANGCGWSSKEKSAGTVVLLNDKGQVTSGTYLLYTGFRGLFAPSSFTVNLVATGLMSTHAVLLFRNNGEPGNQEILQVPIILK